MAAAQAQTAIKQAILARNAALGAGDIVSLRLNNPLFFDAAGGRVAA